MLLAKRSHTRSSNIHLMLLLNILKLARMMVNTLPISSMWIRSTSIPPIILRLVFNTHLVMGTADVRMSNVACLRTYKAGQFSVVFFKPIVSIVYCYVHIFAHVILGKGLKVCSSRLHDDVSHHLVSRRTIADTNRNHAARLTSESTAEKELFLKTLGFFCALKETGVRVMANADPHTLFQWSLSYLQLSFFLFSIHGHSI